MKKVISILVLLLPAISVGQENLCQTKISTSTKGKRNVFLAGGEAYMLFENYLRQAESKNVRVNPAKVVVHFWNGSRTVSYEVGLMERMGDALAGKNIMDVWKKRLASANAQYNEQELKKAHELGWDIVCIGETKQVKVGECSSEAKNHINAGLSFINTKQVDNAIREFEYAIKVSPTCPTAYANLVSAHVAKGNYSLAIEKFNEGVKKAGE
ncbi:MAG: tetratricopeptide repeat protein, partial [Aquificaceae bacterium]|nr:tetratricopeptide repeat protein [Aquificaceae bacterium]